MNDCVLAADFGGTTIKLGLVRGGGIIAQSRLEACAGQPMTDRLEAVARGWELLLAENGRRPQDCAGVALALPFLIDPKSQRALGEFGKFPGANNLDFADWSRGRLGLPVIVENDLRMALLGEWMAGAACGKSDVVMLALGTGIGCAVIADGRLLRGANNRAATLMGHSTIAYESAAGRCGNPGCAEDLASTATLPILARARPDFAGSKLATAARIDYETVITLAAQGDVCSQALWRQSLKVWSALVQNVVIAYDPEMVVLGGGVLRSKDVVLPALERHLHQHMPSLPLQTPIVHSMLGDDAALLGGEVLMQQITAPFVT